MNHISYENATELGLESSEYPMKGCPWPLKIAEQNLMAKLMLWLYFWP